MLSSSSRFTGPRTIKRGLRCVAPPILETIFKVISSDLDYLPSVLGLGEDERINRDGRDLLVSLVDLDLATHLVTFFPLASVLRFGIARAFVGLGWYAC